MGTGRRIAISGFGQFMASGAGRATRIVAGLALIALGLTMGGTAGTVVAAIGLVPLLAGAFGVCLLTGLLAGLWTGASVQRAAEEHTRTTNS